MARDQNESKLDKYIKPIRDSEIKAYEKAVDSALEKTLVNVALLLGVSLASAMAPWTSAQASNATNAQLGSYALLTSTIAGLFALISSITQLSSTVESARELLRHQERTIKARNSLHETVEPETVTNYVFPKSQSESALSSRDSLALTWVRLLKSLSLSEMVPCLVFGMAWALIPPQRDRGGGTIRFTLGDTNVHCLISTSAPAWFSRSFPAQCASEAEGLLLSKVAEAEAEAEEK